MVHGSIRDAGSAKYWVWFYVSVGPPFLIFISLTVLIFAKPWKAIKILPLWVSGLVIEVRRDVDTDCRGPPDFEGDIAEADTSWGRHISPATAENRGHELVLYMKFRGMKAVHPSPRRLLLCTLAPLLFIIMNFWDSTVITQIGQTTISVVSACTSSNACFYTTRDINSMQFTPLTLDLLPIGNCDSFSEIELWSNSVKVTYSSCFSYVFTIRLFFQSIAITSAQLCACTMLVCYVSLPVGSLEEEDEEGSWCDLFLPSSIYGSMAYLLVAAGSLLANTRLYGSHIQTWEGFLFLPCLLLLAASLCEAKRCAGKWATGSTLDSTPMAFLSQGSTDRFLKMETISEWSGQEPATSK